MNREESVAEVDLPDLPQSTLVQGDKAADTTLALAPQEPVVPYAPVAVTPWPSGTGEVTLSTTDTPGTTKAVSNGLPVAVGVPPGGRPAALAGDWTVGVAPHTTSQEAGVPGVVLKLTPPADVDPAAEVAISIDTSGFADLYGPQAAERFGLMVLPECVYSSPTTDDCAGGGTTAGGTTTMSASEGDKDVRNGKKDFQRLPSTVKIVAAKDAPTRTRTAGDAKVRKILSGTVPVSSLVGEDFVRSKPTKASYQDSVQSTSSGVIGALDTGSSASGDFTASPLLSSGSWSSGSSSGAFTYSYQVQVPETAGGLMPKVNLAYSSQSVDGRTSSTNNQASWIGDGWDYNAGTITRTYVNCRQDAKKEGSNNSTHRTADLCWGSENATLSLGGTTTELVWDKAKGKWFTANGDGSTVQLVKGEATGNGAKDGEYWVVTTRDGTRYHFGKNRLPGWSDHGTAADDPTTASVLTVPVYGNHAGEDCYKGPTTTDWTNSWCTQGWRWGLDYVEDVHGNAMSLWWQKDVPNHYARNFNFKEPVPYDRDGWLDHIDYGQRSDNIFTATAPARVGFKVAERCYAVGHVTCSETDFTSKDPGDYRPWFDTPADLRCAAGKLCWTAGPTFWTRKRLAKIETSAQRLTDTTIHQVVDEYRLTQNFAKVEDGSDPVRTGPNTALWLESIQRTGYAREGTTDARTTLNSVRFEPNIEDMPNRVKAVNTHRPGFSRLRISRVINEYGGETVVRYKPVEGDCLSGDLPLLDQQPGESRATAMARLQAQLKANNRFCYPSFWNPDPDVEDIDWFHKYVVDTVEELPNIGGNFTTRTEYRYSNPAWKLAESEFTKKSQRTYSQFAGVEQTTVLTGPADPAEAAQRSKAVTRFFRGLGATVPVKDITGAEIAKDEEAFAGRIAEELTYKDSTRQDTDWLTRSVTKPAATELARRDREDGLSPLRAWRVTEPEETTYTKSSGTNTADPRTVRTVKTTTTYDPTHGLPVLVESLGDTGPGKTGDESCTRSEYTHQTARNLIGLSKQVLVSPTTCADADWTDLTTLSGAFRTAYDGAAYGTPLSDSARGLATESWSLNGTGTGFQTNGTTGFDEVGRVVRRTDPDQLARPTPKSSTITYSSVGPATGQVFKVTTTNVLGHSQVQELEPGRSVTLKTTDANGLVSEAVYDPLGRLSAAWAPGRTPSSSSVPDFRATYTIPAEESDPLDPNIKIRRPPYVTTQARGHDGRIETSVAIYDGLGRERQTQEEADNDSGWLITDTLYNAAGEIYQTNNAYLTREAKPGELFTPASDLAIPNITRYAYDGLGRVTRETPYLKWTDPETKESSSKAYEDRAVTYEYGEDWSKVVQPKGASSYQVFTDALGRTARVDTLNPAAPGGRVSMAYEYDARGQMVKAVNSADPAHPWSWTFDHRGRMKTSTDPDSGTTRTEYDSLDRVLTTTNARGVTVWNDYDELSRPRQQRLTGAGGAVLANFTYDTAPGGKGMPATATRYTDGLAYTQAVNGYTKDYQPTSTTLSLPQSIADTWGLEKDYSYSYSYSDTGALEDATLPAVGRFAAEKLVVRYNEDGKPLSVSGKDWYGSETVYSPYGQVLRSTLGAQPYRVWTQNSYDESSGELQEQAVYREKSGPDADNSVVAGKLVSNRAYTYDPAGNVTSIREKSVGIEERQCFEHDPLGQLKAAWTSSDQEACVNPRNPDGSLNRNADGTLRVTAGKDGSGYWQEYEYDLLGNRTRLTERNLAGDTAKDATSTYAYGKADGSQPHTLTKVSKAFTTPAGAEVKAEATRLYELTGETKSITSVQNGDKQTLTWTHDGKVDRITGQGTGGRTPYVGLADKCLDLRSGLTVAGQPAQLYACNETMAQNWRFTPVPGTAAVPQPNADLGTLRIHDTWCLQPAAATAGSAVQLQKCDGTAAQHVKRNAAGQLIHAGSALCFAVQGAANVNATPIVLAACDATQAAQLWQPQNDTRHIYGPDGERLLTVKGKQATLHLGEAEVTVQQGGALVSTQRTYAAPGGAVMRYAHGTNPEGLVAQTSDHQGSAYAEVALSGGMSVRVRKQDPFGNERGTTAVHMQNHKGFLDKTRDDASGFQPLGARLYDPAVGRFLSADPVVDLKDPLQSNGYAYAHNNPVTHSDPTGLAITLTASERAAALAGAGLSAAQVAQAQATMGKSLTSVILGAAWGILSEFIGLGDAMACFGGDMWSCGSMIIGAIPWTKLGKIPSVLKAVDRTIGAIQAFRAAKKAAEVVLKTAKAAEAAALRAKKDAIEKAKREAAQRAKKKAAEQAKRTSDKAVSLTKNTGNSVHKQAQAKAAPKVSSVASPGRSGGKVSLTKPGGSSGGSSRGGGGSSGGGGAGKAEEGGSCPINNSFTPGTKVLMADGSTKPIEKVKPGDKVLATDPKTGETRVETVTAGIKGRGLKHLVTITIALDGENAATGSRTVKVTATEGHPFWVPELRQWIDAVDLRSGQLLRTDTGTYVQISAVQRRTAQDATVHNLTVSNLHTYYVLAGSAPVLVHNCGESSLDAQADAGEIRGSDFAAEYESRSGHVYRSDNKEPVTAPDEMVEIFEQQDHPMNGGCAEMQCLSKAYAREGEPGIRGGNMTTVHVSDTSKGDHGAPATPCKACRRVMDSLGVNY
ncbi:ricin-type beta-trefoil lectin domain protein [Streptomyces sp. Act-28]